MEMSDQFRKKIGRVFTQCAVSATVLRQNKLYKEALDCLFVLSEGDETYEHGVYAYEIGLCYIGLGDMIKAKQYLEISVLYGPEISDHHNALALCARG